MPKKALKKGPKKIDAMPSLDYLAAALNQQSKEMLIKMIVNIASKNRTLQRSLDDGLGFHRPDDQLTQQTRQAIADATDYDERDSGTNFDYDQAAYELVEKNFHNLPNKVVVEWCDKMELADKIGCICDQELKSLRKSRL